MSLWIENPARPGSLGELASHIHPSDAAELQAAGIDVHGALAQASTAALRVHTGELVCLFGCAPAPDTPGLGIPWMLCTHEVDRVPRVAMAAVSDAVVSSWMQGHDMLANIVHARNSRAIRFVEWLGFTVVRAPCGPGDQFYPFHWRRDDV